MGRDNAGALTLAKLEALRMTPRSKHYGLKYHWFRSKLKEYNITLLKIASENQLADILTKSLTREKFRDMRKQLMGW